MLPEWVTDTLTVVVIGFVLWGLAGDALKKIGLVAILERVRPVVRSLWDGVVWVAYKLFLGRAPNEKHLTHDPHKAAHVMSNSLPNEQTNKRMPLPAGVIEPDENDYPVPGDITRYTIVKLLVASGWSVSQIRTHLKGDFADISQEAERAKTELEEKGWRIPSKRKSRPRPRLAVRA